MKTLDPVWAAYKPSDEAPWDLRRVVHLHRRAAFAGTWAELQRDLKDGPERAIDRLLTGTANAAPGRRNSTRPPSCSPTRRSRGDEIGRLKAGVVLPHAVRPRPAGREAHPAVARPLRHRNARWTTSA